MKCPKCSHLNEDEARYCNNCGFPLMEKKKDWTSILLLAYCVSVLFFTIIWTAVFPILDFIGITDFKFIQTISFIISSAQTLTLLVIPFAIPKIGLKIVAFIVIGIAIVWSIVRGFLTLTSIYSTF